MKRLLVVVICFVLFLGLFSLAWYKKENKNNKSSTIPYVQSKRLVNPLEDLGEGNFNQQTTREKN